ncbi:MAG TPA: glycosyltransferase [Syntrophales bacterium]|nr:glycosyltransferase [Syntrophales bacterium]
MNEILQTIVIGFNYFIGFYFGLVNAVYSVLLAIALIVILRHIRRIRYAPFRDLENRSEMPPVAVLIPARNERSVIIRTIESVRGLLYPWTEIVVINDGSTDDTLQLLIKHYNLRRIDPLYRDIIKTRPVRGFYYTSEIPNLIVVDKENGGKSDALNCGINVCKSPYICTLDADSVFEPESLIRLVTPLVQSTVPVIASGGVVRVLNGVKRENGVMKQIELPRHNSLAIFQIVEYLRSFLFGRVGLDALNCNLILSGAFSMFQKAAVITVGGFKQGNVTEDMELVVRLHKHYSLKGDPYVIRFVSDPICWTEVPETLKMLGRQRRRWHLGMIQSIWEHKTTIFNPRYGRLGMFAMPYNVFIEMVSPIIEFLGYIIVIISYILGMIDYDFFMLFLFLAIGYGIFLSTTGIFLEELTYRRYPKWTDLFVMLAYGALENFGYRQINSFWRFSAFFQFIFGRGQWETVRHKGEKKQAATTSAA